jgi:hypothetical protein
VENELSCYKVFWTRSSGRRSLTLYPPANVVAGLQRFEIVGVAQAAAVHELEAVLRVPVIVVPGN